MTKGAYLFLTIISSLLFIVWSGVRISSYIDFNNNCGGYLSRAANANSIELAEQNLTKAINYLDKNDLTEGHVSVFMKQPKNDITYWYNNLKSAQEQLRNVDENISELEKSNILMKLRETLTDNGDSGTVLVCPDGISVYPNNVFLFWLGVLSSICICLFGLLTLFTYD